MQSLTLLEYIVKLAEAMRYAVAKKDTAEGTSLSIGGLLAGNVVGGESGLVIGVLLTSPWAWGMVAAMPATALGAGTLFAIIAVKGSASAEEIIVKTEEIIPIEQAPILGDHNNTDSIFYTL